MGSNLWAYQDMEASNIKKHLMGRHVDCSRSLMPLRPWLGDDGLSYIMREGKLAHPNEKAKHTKQEWIAMDTQAMAGFREGAPRIHMIQEFTSSDIVLRFDGWNRLVYEYQEMVEDLLAPEVPLGSLSQDTPITRRKSIRLPISYISDFEHHEIKHAAKILGQRIEEEFLAMLQSMAIIEPQSGSVMCWANYAQGVMTANRNYGPFLMMGLGHKIAMMQATEDAFRLLIGLVPTLIQIGGTYAIMTIMVPEFRREKTVVIMD